MKYDDVVTKEIKVECSICKCTEFKQSCNYIVYENVYLIKEDREFNIVSFELDSVDIKQIEHENIFTCKQCGQEYFITKDEFGEERLAGAD
jgi:hypothetical protein